MGGIAGPLLFGNLIGTGDKGPVAIGFVIGAAIMALGGVAELFFGVSAEGEQLEDIAAPLTATDPDGAQGADGSSGDGAPGDEGPDRSAANRERARDEKQRRQQEEARRVAAEQRLRERMERERAGWRRYRPGPGRISSSPGMVVSSSLPPADLDREIQAITQALDEHGATDLRELGRLVGARYWGPGVFREALRQAVAGGAAHRNSRTVYAPPAEDDTRSDDPHVQ